MAENTLINDLNKIENLPTLPVVIQKILSLIGNPVQHGPNLGNHRQGPEYFRASDPPGELGFYGMRAAPTPSRRLW